MMSCAIRVVLSDDFKEWHDKLKRNSFLKDFLLFVKIADLSKSEK
jgi:hypothetical protein